MVQQHQQQLNVEGPTFLRGLTKRQIAWRLFLTCWLIYTLHFSTNIVREIYLAVAISDHLSFQVDDYANLHDDIFEKPGYGWHIGSNPGASMLAAIPYALSRPIIDRVTAAFNARRLQRGQSEPPPYRSPNRADRAFYQEAWRRGYDVKLGLAAFVTQALCMAPISALGVALMFGLLCRVFGSSHAALGLSLLYAFGTPVFYRTGFVNHNLMLGHVAFMGFLVLRGHGSRLRNSKARFFLGGLAGGGAVLLDYSGVIPLAGLLAYSLGKSWQKSSRQAIVRHSLWYALGAIGPLALLWFYQWQSFGHPFFPAQHWMPPVDWIDQGYQGVGWPQLELFAALLLDYRYGLLTSSPVLGLAVLAPFFSQRRLPKLEIVLVFGLFAAFLLLFSGVNYVRWQFNTGVRYMAPVFPFLFLAATLVLVRLPPPLRRLAFVLSFAQAWCMAMYRDVAAGQVEWYEPERGLGVLDPVLQVLRGGFQLPVLTTLSRMDGRLKDYVADGVSPLPLFLFVAALIVLIWARSPADQPSR